MAATSKSATLSTSRHVIHVYRSEPVFDDAEPEEPEYYEEPADNAEDVGGGEDPDQKMDGDNIIHSGDPSAVASGLKPQKNTVADLKKRKIPKENRTTTPYMTKYERARVLGTRALQIRCVRR